MGELEILHYFYIYMINEITDFDPEVSEQEIIISISGN